MNADNQGKPCGKVEAVFSTYQRIVEIHLGGVVRPSAVHPFDVEGRGWVSAAEVFGATSAGDDAAVSCPNPREQPMPDDQPHPASITGFVAGTPILTPNGSKPIEDVKPGDVILTRPDDGHDHHEPEAHEDDHTDEDARWWEWN